MDEVRLAVRRLRRRPGATAASVVTLATAIGAAAATWSIVSAVLLNPLPVKEPGRLVLVEATSRSARALPGGTMPVTHHLYPVYEQVRQSGIFEQTAAGGRWIASVGANGAAPSTIPVYFASAGFFDVLGVRMGLGRGFEAADDRRGAPLVAVLSERFWRRTFNGDPAAVGKTILVGGKTALVIGVADRKFRGLNLAEAPDLYVPLENAGAVTDPWFNPYALPGQMSSPSSWVAIIGKLKPNTNALQTAARLNGLLQTPGNARSQFGVIHVNAAALPAAARGSVRQFTRLLIGTVGLLVLIGCASVATLLLIRTESRREELATCMALGASRARLAWGVAIEGAIAALGGALLAVPVASWLFAGLRGFQLPGGVNLELLDLSVDGRVVAGVCAAALTATLIVAAIAAGVGFSGSVPDALRSRSGATLPPNRRRTHRVLVSAQVAIALVLVGGAGLFARSLAAALNLNSSLATSRILSASIGSSAPRDSAAPADEQFTDLVQRLQANPAFSAVGTAAFVSSMGSGGVLVIDGQQWPVPSSVAITAVDPGYFTALGLTAARGRMFSADDRGRAPGVAIISESFASLLSGADNPLGRRITMPFRSVDKPADVLTVVGVVPDVVTNVNVLQPLALYMPIAQALPSSGRTVFLRAASDVDAAGRAAAAAIRQFDPRATPPAFVSMRERLGMQMGPQRLGAYVLGALGAMAILLTVVGTYVLAESMAVMRMREMAIRAALGATGRQLGALVLRETAVLVGAGLSGGLLLSWAGAGTMRSLLYQMQPLDPVTLGGVAAGILLLAVLVSVRPAVRAARVDLASMLRAE